jgi:small subunit ribosomal protein S20
LANIKSQIKRNRQNEKRRLSNRSARGAARAAVAQARTALESKVPESREAVFKAISALDKAAGDGVIHANAAARRKSRLMKKLANMGEASVEPAVKSAPKKKAPAKKAAAKAEK